MINCHASEKLTLLKRCPAFSHASTVSTKVPRQTLTTKLEQLNEVSLQDGKLWTFAISTFMVFHILIIYVC